MVQMLHWPNFKEIRPGKINLIQIELLLKALGDPHKKLPPVIHITGTNGKGSTLAFMKSILEKAGLKVHTFTSPHLERFNERIVLAGKEITDSYLFSTLEECRIAVEKNNIDISFFEAITAAAFLAFSRVFADIALVEVGLGGRLDATNVIINPAVSVITPISFDHTAFLGPTLAKIAYEKSGIIKENSPCVVSLQLPEVHAVIEEYAEKKHSRLFRFEYDFGVYIRLPGKVASDSVMQGATEAKEQRVFNIHEDSSTGATKQEAAEVDFSRRSIEDGLLHYKSQSLEMRIKPPSLPGYHQYINAATAIAALQQLQGVQFSAHTFEEGIANAVWKGRIEHITHGRLKKMLPDTWEIWLDGAHNEAGAQSFAAWLEAQPVMKTYVILGMTRNRDVGAFISHFKGLIAGITCVSVYLEPLSYRASDMISLIRDSDLKAISTIQEDIEAALMEIIKIANNKEKIRILITGSLFLIADFFAANKN